MPLFLFPYCELAVPRVERRFYQNPRQRVNTIFRIFSLQISQRGRAATGGLNHKWHAVGE